MISTNFDAKLPWVNGILVWFVQTKDHGLFKGMMANCKNTSKRLKTLLLQNPNVNFKHFLGEENLSLYKFDQPEIMSILIKYIIGAV